MYDLRLVKTAKDAESALDFDWASSLPLASEPQFRYFTVENLWTAPPGPPESLPLGWLPPPPPPVEG